MRLWLIRPSNADGLTISPQVAVLAGPGPVCDALPSSSTVSKPCQNSLCLEPLGLALSEKQIPQIVENTKKRGELLEPLEADGMRPRQVRYQAALRPDYASFFDFKPLPALPTLSRQLKSGQKRSDRGKTVTICLRSTQRYTVWMLTPKYTAASRTVNGSS